MREREGLIVGRVRRGRKMENSRGGYTRKKKDLKGYSGIWRMGG